jgi:hypothetical protein
MVPYLALHDPLVELEADFDLLVARHDGVSNVLFVGRFGEGTNEADLLIRAFRHYHATNRRSRLTIVHCPERGISRHPDVAVAAFERERMAPGTVEVIRGVTPSRLKAYYLTAAVFLCVSSDRWIMPALARAVAFSVPIVAWASEPARTVLSPNALAFAAPHPVQLAMGLRRCLDERHMARRVERVQGRGGQP